MKTWTEPQIRLTTTVMAVRGELRLLSTQTDGDTRERLGRLAALLTAAMKDRTPRPRRMREEQPR